MLSYLEAGQAYLERLIAWLVADVLTMANLVQVPALALTGGLAWLVARPVRHWICQWVSQEFGRSDEWASRRDWIINRIVPLTTPAIWAVGLWIAVELAERRAWPHDVARVAVNLLLAWLGIRLVADLVPSRSLARLIALTAWTLAALNILHLLRPLADVLDGIAITTGTLRLSALSVIKGFLSLAVLLWVANFASRLFEQRITRVKDLTPRAQVLFGKLLKITLISLAVVFAITSVGIDLSTLALLTGAVGVGIGLGLQKSVSNLFSGFILLLDRSIKPGDVIEVGGTYGWVTSLGARYVAVETRDGTEYLIPNEDIITQQVLNWSHKSERVRLKLDVRAPLDADVELVLALMREAASRPARILKSPAPNALVMRFGESAIELQLRFWIADAQNGVHNVKGEVL
ncbi:MAG TPA: mechanosensitive ion channel domain-containing protein, partial [Microvirga sp.]|nr:mechanosensitive ion channel domain-containing protein [Microvirga sp.]